MILKSLKSSFLTAVLFLTLVSGASALDVGGVARVVQVVDGDTVMLGTPVFGANQVRLVGIQAPKLPLGRDGFKKWPLADEA